MTQAHTKTYSISLLFLLHFTGVLLLVCSCANPIPPTGGPKDAEPPHLITAESTPNYLTGFDRREIILTFDEWIQLKDQNLQIIISPPLQYRPEITLKGKSIIIEFDEREVLRERTTYSINFGSSIADVNEGNILDQYKFIFSTGTFIDSLQIGGRVFNAATGEPAKQALVLLHDDLSDSAFIKQLPVYFAKANDAGQWVISNIRSDTFRLYTLTDQNLNYRYDQAGEQIGFYEQLVILPDTTHRNYELVLFEEARTITILDIDRRGPGVTKIILSGNGEELTVSPSIEGSTVLWDVMNDTLTIWNATQDSFEVIIRDDLLIVDTVLIRGFRGTAQPRMRLISAARTLHPSDPIVLQSRTPIAAFNRDRFSLMLGDSMLIPDPQIAIDSTDRRRLLVSHRWLEQEQYALTVLPGGITDIFGALNDTVNVNFQISPRNSFGVIMADITGLKDSLQYIVELVHPQSGVLARRFVRNVSTARVEFAQLQPQTYQIRIVEDANANGRWDTGNALARRQPEHIYIHALEPLRAGWDLEATIPWPQK